MAFRPSSEKKGNTVKNSNMRLAILAITAIAIVLSPTAAQAADSNGSDPGDLKAQVERQVSEIPLSSLRVETQELLEQREAEGATVQSVSYATFDQVGSEESSAPAEAVLAAPADCGVSTAILTSPGRVMHDAVFSCTTTVPQTIALDLELVGLNPYNPLDTRVLETGRAETRLQSFLTGSIFWICNNQNQTTFQANTRATIVVSGTTYVTTGGDRVPGLLCGW